MLVAYFSSGHKHFHFTVPLITSWSTLYKKRSSLKHFIVSINMALVGGHLK